MSAFDNVFYILGKTYNGQSSNNQNYTRGHNVCKLSMSLFFRAFHNKNKHELFNSSGNLLSKPENIP